MTIWDEWKERQFAKKKVVKKEKIPVVYRPITEEEKQMIVLLNKCTFLPGSYDKRFVRNMSGAEVITEKQAALLREKMHRYRKQLIQFAKEIIAYSVERFKDVERF